MNKLILLGISYIGIRNMYYFPYLEGPFRDKTILYSSYIGNTICMMSTFPFTVPMAILSDIEFIEKRWRKVPIDKYDRPFMYGSYYLTKEYIESLPENKKKIN